MSNRPIIGISMGDPAGIGPEICLKALSLSAVYDYSRPLIIGDAGVLQMLIDRFQMKLKLLTIKEPSLGIYEHGTVNVLDLANIDLQAFEFNKVSAMCGHASFEYVHKAIQLALNKEIDATVTGPIHKEAIHLAGHHFAGHTEIFAHFTETKNYSMMLAEGNFRVVHVSTHVSLLQAIQLVKRDRVLEVIQLADHTLKQMGIKKPKIAVAGLNPHAGEGGLFGTEEMEEIIPAIQAAIVHGIDVHGPFPPDTIFPIMKGGKYDVVVCMYHDQGHIPTKLLGFSYNDQTGQWEGMSGVNITLGLPIIRVSVDHGVAFDKGGKGEANPQSMIQAIDYAQKFAVKKMDPI